MHNDFQNLHDTVGELRQLGWLNVKSNRQLSTLPDAWLYTLPRLSTLLISGWNIQQLSPALAHMPGKPWVDVNYDPITFQVL